MDFSLGPFPLQRWSSSIHSSPRKSQFMTQLTSSSTCDSESNITVHVKDQAFDNHTALAGGRPLEAYGCAQKGNRAILTFRYHHSDHDLGERDQHGFSGVDVTFFDAEDILTSSTGFASWHLCRRRAIDVLTQRRRRRRRRSQ